MRRISSITLFCLVAVLILACLPASAQNPSPAPSQVQALGDVSFAVPGGWTYQPGNGYGAMALKNGQNFWVVAVYAPLPASGNPSADLKTAWQRIVLAGRDYQGFPWEPYYDISGSVGYPGKRADASSLNRATYTRLFTLEAGRVFVPVVAVSNDGLVLNSLNYLVNAVIGSVRLAPLKAAPIRTSLSLADLAGDWQSGLSNTIAYYDAATGAYNHSSTSAVGQRYHIDAAGAFTYKMGGMINNAAAADSDSGTVELGSEFVVFHGRNHIVRYRFLNLQQAIDGSTVLTLLPPAEDVSRLNFVRDAELWSRK